MGSFFRQLLLLGVGALVLPLSCSSGDSENDEIGEDGSDDASSQSSGANGATTTAGIDIDDDDAVIDIGGEPCAADVEVVGWTAKRKGLPFIAGFNSPVAYLPD